MDISIRQACGIWGELMNCYYGRNGFGTHTAEIYAYRLMPFDPRLLTKKEKDLQDILRAAKALVDLMDMFCEEYDTEFKVEVSGNDLKDRHLWLIQHGAGFDHRVHVTCTRPEKKKKS